MGGAKIDFLTACNIHIPPTIHMDSAAATLINLENRYQQKVRPDTQTLVEFPGRYDDGSVNSYIRVKDPAKSIRQLDRPAELVTPARITIVIDYPLTKEARFEHNAGPYTRAQLAQMICDRYAQIYREENATALIRPGYLPGMMNRNTTDGCWGIWGHVIGDLLLGTVYIDSNGVCTLEIDS